MSQYFLDSSALVKRYLPEQGTGWLRALADSIAGNTIILAEITRVEVAAALAARHRAQGGISLKERDDAVDLLLKHCAGEYRQTPIVPPVLSDAVRLTQTYRLRGYDAVQLATAIAAHQQVVAAGLPGLTFVAADDDLLMAAQAEGLATDNPNDY